MMVTKIYAEPAIEPVSLQELKEHLRLDSGSFADNLTTVQSLAHGSKAIANDYITHVGAGVDVLGYQAVVLLNSGTNDATGTVDAKIQESDDNATWTDWSGGAFTQVTTANDNAIQEKAYTGTKQYIRVVAKVLLAACVFGADVSKYASDATEDAILTAIITAARQQAEAFTKRAFITQTWNGYLDEFPVCNSIALPWGNLTTLTSIAYTDSAGTVTTMTVTTDYLVDTVQEPARIVLPYGVTWPALTLHPVNPIAIRFVCGYGATAASVPAAIRTAIKMIAADLYAERGEKIIGNVTVVDNDAANMLLYPFRLWEF
jgi:uncharacterized phiE125 gp8 family phage protein